MSDSEEDLDFQSADEGEDELKSTNTHKGAL